MLVLVVVAVAGCAALGSLHLAIIERRAADNVAVSLALRLDAEAAAQRGMAALTHAALPVLQAGGGVVAGAGPNGHATAVSIDPLGGEVLLIRGTSRLPHHVSGAAVAHLLLHPPAHDPDMRPAAAAIAAAGLVEVLPDARIESADTAILTTAPAAVVAPDPAAVVGRIEVLTPDTDIAGRIAAIGARLRPPAGAPVRTVDGDFVMSGTADGLILVTGDLVIRAGTTFNGLLIVGGNLELEAGARITGAAHVGGGAMVAGEILHDAQAVENAVDRAAMRLARPPAGRAWLPGFQ